MHRFQQFAFIGTLIAGSLLVQGQEPVKKDDEKKVETTLDMRAEAWASFQSADANLNAVYKKLLSRLDDEGQKSKLRNAQKTWLKYRDLNAEFESALYEGGSIALQIHTGALTRITIERTKELQLQLDSNFDK